MTKKNDRNDISTVFSKNTQYDFVLYYIYVYVRIKIFIYLVLTD